MNCREAKIFLYSYIDGELCEQDAINYETHLKECELCRNAYNFEYELKEKIKKTFVLEKNKVKTPECVIKNIKLNKKYSFTFPSIQLKKVQAIAAILFSVFFISPSFVGYTTLSEENMKDYLNKIDNYSNNKTEIEKWLKNNCLYSTNSLEVDKNKINIHPIGFSIKKDHPIFFYHYKGKRILFKRTINSIKNKNLKIININNKKFYIENYKGLNNVYWYNKNILNSITTKLNQNEIKKILVSIR